MTPSIQDLPVSTSNTFRQQAFTQIIDHVESQDTNGGSRLDASKIRVSLTTAPQDLPAADAPNVHNHQAFTDHMITVSWTEDRGWAEPNLVPYGPLALMPSASVLQYATSCYEGMKVFRGSDGKLRLFRPMYNCRRMLASAKRISLPTFAPEELLKLIKKLCAIDCPKWLPADGSDSFLYIRPTLLGDDPSLGFQIPSVAKLVIFMSYWPLPKLGHNLTAEASSSSNKKSGLKLLASKESEVRAWPGGTGFAKIGANYGPALLAHGAAKRGGYDQVLWLLGKECQITEAGSTNFFVIWRSAENGKLQLVTAPLDDGVILAGINRQTILDMARERFAVDAQPKLADGTIQHLEALEVVERKFTMFDVTAAIADNRLVASFAVGTANFITPVSQIQFRDQMIQIGVDLIPHVSVLQHWLSDIMYGATPSSWTVAVSEE